MKSLLIANRGEIAVRVIRTARQLGMRTIAVYSELDRDALHVRLADEAWNIGGAPAAESYLNGPRIVRAAWESDAEAIHPGYGFLAENADFARQVTEAGLTWVGPPPEAIAMMGDKIASRRTAEAAGATVVPGSSEPVTDPKQAAKLARGYGFPVAVKASHGGGGKGMRVADNEEDLAEALEGAQREAGAYFGNSAVYLEKYLVKPRHIEAQIIVDDHDHAVFLGERDCSVQRRHQKLIEEAPAPGLTKKRRAALGKAALAIAEACDYRNAGTVEFLMDEEGEFYFLEMNTRLQVEHAVTEMVTGIDLVAEQLRVADGLPLSFERTEISGHAIEMRINAEDPAAGYLPSPGTIADYREPAGPRVRVDSWVEPGTAVSQYYDNLLAKLVVWGRTRSEAVSGAKRALHEYRVGGVATTIPVHQATLDHPVFAAGRAHTRFLEEEVAIPPEPPETGAGRESGPALARRSLTVEVGGRRFDVAFWAPETVAAPGGAPRPARKPPSRRPSGAAPAGEPGMVASPMQGTIVKVSAQAGSRVAADQPICVLEAMKMENEIRAPMEGELVEMRVRPGDAVRPGEVIAIIR